MTQSASLSGVHAALTTPFDARSGKLDLDALDAHAAWLLGTGVSGLVLNTRLGECESLNQDERQAIVESVARITKGRAKLIVDVSAPHWRIAADQTRYAAEFEADAVLLLPPTNHLPTARELVDHYQSVAQFDLPVIVANDPSSSRIDLTADDIERLLQVEGIVAVADGTGDVRRLSRIAERAPHLQLLCGADDLALESALMGAAGWIGRFAGALPRESVRIFELGLTGDVAAALPYYRAMLPLLRWSSGSRFVEAVKHTITLLGLSAGGPPRPPRRAIDGDDAGAIADQLATARAANAA